MMRPDVFFAGEVMVKQKALNSPSPLFFVGFTGKIKTTLPFTILEY